VTGRTALGSKAAPLPGQIEEAHQRSAEKGKTAMATKRKAKKKQSKTATKTKGKARLTAARRKKTRPKVRRGQIGVSEMATTVQYNVKGLGAGSAGQSGDLEGISEIAGAGSESVEELLEEGNAFEAEVLEGIERAADVPRREVRAREVPEDDVPEEYLDRDKD
jgi:hypothetical protein